MKLTKLTELPFPFQLDEALFSEPTHVQSADKRTYKNQLLVESPKRYKLFTDATDYVLILNGNGFIKWARGELRFTEGDIFCFEQTGEYELNGACRFVVVRN